MLNFENTKRRLVLRKKEDFYHNKTVIEYQADKNKQNFPNQVTL